jgi:hypothetical protein
MLRTIVSRGEVAAHSLLRQIEDHVFGLLDHVARLALASRDQCLDLLADLQQPSLRRRVADDLRIRLVAGGDVRARHDVENACPPARGLEVTVLDEPFGDRDRLDRLPDQKEVVDRAKDAPVALFVKVVARDHRDGLGDIARGVHQRGEEHLLGLDVLRGWNGFCHAYGTTTCGETSAADGVSRAAG